jgi:LynF/TruF/PatF family peptide O-prenyltransferase
MFPAHTTLLQRSPVCALCHDHSVVLTASETAGGKTRGMRPLLQMYEFHKREFGIEDNGFFDLIEEFLSRAPCSLLECSIKVSINGIHPKRIRLGYGQESIQEGLHEIPRFLERISAYRGVDLDQGFLSKIVGGGLDAAKVEAAGLGLDYRQRGGSSKVKCYFMVRDYPEIVDQILSMHPPVDHIRDYLIHDVVMFGIEMYFDGRTGVEIYCYFNRKDLRNSELMDKLRLRKAINGLLEECNLLHISFAAGGTRIVHVHPIHPTRFIYLLGNRQLSMVYSNVQIIRYLLNRSLTPYYFNVNLAFAEDEMASRNLRHINLQYGIAART